MPSPVGHSLAGVAMGWALNRPARPWRPLVWQTMTLAAISVAPDLDLLWGRHSRETHSIGAGLAVAAVAAWRRWPIGSTRPRIFGAAFLAWFIHPVMDSFAIDNAEPIGVMLWWPFSSRFVHASHPFFDPISRAWSDPGVWLHNFTAASHELLLIAPVLFVVWVLRRTYRRT